MSQRHQTSQTSVIPEAREDRKREHRRLRQKVRQDLHVAVEEGDVEEVVLDRPHPTHGYREDHEMPTSNAVPAPPNRTEHWKQSFWKRRKNERRRRAAEFNAAAN